MPPPPVPPAVKEEVIAAAPPSPLALPPLVPSHVREEVLAASAPGPMPLVPGSPGVRAAEDPQRLIRDRQRKRRLGFNCCSSPTQRSGGDSGAIGARVPSARRPGDPLPLSDRRTFSPGLSQPPESPRSQVRGAMASKAKRTVVLAYHSMSIDALFALLAGWLRNRSDPSVALRCLPQDPLDSVETRLQQAESVIPEQGASSLYLLGLTDSDGYVQELSRRWPECSVVSIVSELHHEQSTACMAWDHFDNEAAESTGIGSGSGEALAEVAGFGGDIGRLRLVFSYVEDHELRRDELDDSQAFASGLASLLQRDLPWDPAAKGSTLFDVLLSLSPATLIENGKLVKPSVRRTLSGWGDEGQ